MTDFIFNPRKNYPFILTDSSKGTVLISGISIPDDPDSFFMPLQAWVDDYLTNQAESLEVNFEMFFFNPTTSKYFHKLLQTLNNHYDNGKKVKVNWFYDADDEDILEEGEDFRDFFKIPFEIISFQTPTSFSINKTDKTPLVYFDQSGDIIIEGTSMGNKPWNYYHPLIKWMERVRFDKETKSINLEISLLGVDDLNLLYIKHIFTLLELIDGKDDKTVSVIWVYADKRIRVIGVDYSEKFRLNLLVQEKEKQGS